MAKLKAFAAPLWEACEKRDGLSPALECVWFKDGYAYASDGHILIKSAIKNHSIKSPENLEGKAIHWTVFKDLMKYEILTAESDGVMSEYIKYPYSDAGDMPGFEGVIPVRNFGTVGYIGVKPSDLSRLSKCLIDGDILRMQFIDETRAIVVTTAMQFTDHIDQIGIMMPYKVPAPGNGTPLSKDPLFE